MCCVDRLNPQVNAVQCRGDWCRVEVQGDIGGEDIDDMNELQLRIDESLGRDSEIRFGKQSGNSRVLFIR